MEGLGRKRRCVIDFDVYVIPSSYIEQLNEYRTAGEYEAYNSLLDYIRENYETKERMSDLFYYM